MFFIWGSTSKVATADRGEFFCPRCQTEAKYNLERVSRYFTFFFIPLFATKTLGEYIRCRNCHAEMRREVLRLTRQQIQQATANWQCPACGNHNPPARRTCLACGAARHQAAPPPLPGQFAITLPPHPGQSEAGPLPLPGQSGLAGNPPVEDPLSVIASPPPFASAQPRRHFGVLLKLVLGCGGLLTLSFVALVAVAIFSSPKPGSPASDAWAGRHAFDEASKSIGSNADGAGHGNTPEARELAGNLSELLGIMGKKIPHLYDQETLDITHGKFIVYCQLNKDSCAFLVHVPNLRHFTSDTKNEIAKLCYATACAALKSSGSDGNIRKVAVATRGLAVYDTALQGSYPPPKDTTSLDHLQKLEIQAADVPGLFPFFVARTETESSSTPAASSTSASRETSKASPPAELSATPVASASSPPTNSPTLSATPMPSSTPIASETPAAAQTPPVNQRPPPDFNKPPPSWVPIYSNPVRPPHGSRREDDGAVKGRTNFETTDPLDKIKDFYESKLRADGFEITETQPPGRLFEKVDIVGKKADGKFSVHTEITQMKARTFVTVTYEGPEDAGAVSRKPE